MVALDALSAYWIASHTTEEKALNVTLSSMGRNGYKSHLLQLNNHQVKGLEEELKVTSSFPPSWGGWGYRGQVRSLFPTPSPALRVPWEDCLSSGRVVKPPGLCFLTHTTVCL